MSVNASGYDDPPNPALTWDYATQETLARLNAAAAQFARGFQPWIDAMTRLTEAFRAYGLLDPASLPPVPNGAEYSRRQRARKRRRP